MLLTLEDDSGKKTLSGEKYGPALGAALLVELALMERISVAPHERGLARTRAGQRDEHQADRRPRARRRAAGGRGEGGRQDRQPDQRHGVEADHQGTAPDGCWSGWSRPGVLTESRTDVLGLRRWPTVDPLPEEEVRRRLQSCLVGERAADRTDRRAGLAAAGDRQSGQGRPAGGCGGQEGRRQRGPRHSVRATGAGPRSRRPSTRCTRRSRSPRARRGRRPGRRPVGFSRTELESFRDAAVPDLVGPGPAAVVRRDQSRACGRRRPRPISPIPGNRFYPALRLAGIVDRDLDRAGGMTDDDRALSRRPRASGSPIWSTGPRSGRTSSAGPNWSPAPGGWPGFVIEHRPPGGGRRRDHGVPHRLPPAEGQSRAADRSRWARRCCGWCPIRAD